MTIQTAGTDTGHEDKNKRLGVTLATRYDIDNFIIGFLIMYMFVYAAELLILVPCGSFQGLGDCVLPPVSEAFWGSYFKIDPLFLAMPPFYVAIMSFQDYIYNPWWIVCLFMFWTGRQELAGFKTITLVVSGLIIATCSVIFGAQMPLPHYTPNIMAALVLINGPWIAGPIVYIWRLRHIDNAESMPRRVSGSAIRGMTMMLLPVVGYVVIDIIANRLAA